MRKWSIAYASVKITRNYHYLPSQSPHQSYQQRKSAQESLAPLQHTSDSESHHLQRSHILPEWIFVESLSSKSPTPFNHLCLQQDKPLQLQLLLRKILLLEILQSFKYLSSFNRQSFLTVLKDPLNYSIYYIQSYPFIYQ